MFEIDKFTNIILSIALFVLAPLGVWKVFEIIIWLFRNIRVDCSLP